MLKKILVSVLIIITLGIFVAERNPRVKEAVSTYFKNSFEATCDCSMSYRVESLSLWRLSLSLADVTVVPHGHEQWRWHADRYVTTLSWKELVMAGAMAMKVQLENVTASSKIKGNAPAIMDHLRLMVAGPSLSITSYIKFLSLRHLSCTIADDHHPLHASFALDLSTGRYNQVTSIHCALADAHISYGPKALLSGAQGSIDCSWYDSATSPDMTVEVSCAAQSPLLPAVTHIVGNWAHDHGSLKLATRDGLVSLEGCHLEALADGLGISATVHADCVVLGGMFSIAIPSAVKGMVVLEGKGKITSAGIVDVAGQLHLNDVRIAHVALGSALLSIAQEGDSYAGSIAIQGPVPLQGSYTVNLSQRRFDGTVHTQEKYVVPMLNWSILPKAQITLAYDPRELVHGSCNAQVHTAADDMFACSGSYASDGQTAHAQMKLGSRSCAVDGALLPTPAITKFVYGAKNAPLISLKQTDDSSLGLAGSCDVTIIKELCALCGYSVNGQGMLDVSATYSSSRISAALHLREGALHIPYLYNCMSGFDAQVVADSEKRTVAIENISCQFHQGSISCVQAEVALDHAYRVRTARVPLVLQDWLIALAGEFSAELSGTVTYEQQEGIQPHIAGDIAIDHAKLKENILSEGFLQRIRSGVGSMQPAATPEVTCSLNLATKTPFHVNTSFLETDAQVKLHIHNRLSSPDLSGSIELSGGQLLFPYKPLYIRKGALYFMPGNPLDPLIELMAANTVKSHNVRLQVTGSLAAPSCILDASPSLREEQIVSLLIAGTPEMSLTSLASAMVSANITALLFDHIQSSQTLNRYWGALLKPFKDIHVTPRFSDQSARGGIRTAVEVDVGDRWRALIEKNLALTEDTKFEVEYRLSDDVSLKGVRNERGDVCGEVEMHVGF